MISVWISRKSKRLSLIVAYIFNVVTQKPDFRLVLSNRFLLRWLGHVRVLDKKDWKLSSRRLNDRAQIGTVGSLSVRPGDSLISKWWPVDKQTGQMPRLRSLVTCFLVATESSAGAHQHNSAHVTSPVTWLYALLSTKDLGWNSYQVPHFLSISFQTIFGHVLLSFQLI